MGISQKMVEFSKRGSWIRRMFEQGSRLKAEFGADNVFDFSLGNPDLEPPMEFDAALKRLVAGSPPGSHGYMPNGGYPHVRQAVAAQLGIEQGVALGGSELLMTCGAAGALNVALKALLNPGEEVILLAPYFVEYNFYVDNHGGVSRVVRTAADFTLDLAAIQQAITDKTKAIIINSPNNPTGQIYSADDLAGLASLLAAAQQKHGTSIFLISDEPYRKIVYDGEDVPSIMKAYRNSIIASSYSKELSLPGERIGYLAVHPEIDHKTQLVEALTLANRILGYVNAPALAQRVVGELQGVRVDCGIYQRRRDLFCDILADCGYHFIRPKGAFYIFPQSPVPDDVEFVALLQKQRVLAVPGMGFGCPGHFRLAYCVGDQVIEKSAAAFRQAYNEAVGR